jgi:hypothetical protein
MDFGALLSRAWDIIWEHKFLILLGILVALTGGRNVGSTNAGANFDRDGDMPRFEDPEWPRFEQGRPLGWLGPMLIITGTLGLLGVGLLVGLALWTISTLARGGLIAGVDAIERGEDSDFGQAFAAGWQRGWSLVSIGLLAGLPSFLLVAGGLGLGGAFAGLGILLSERGSGTPFFVSGAVIFGAVLCVAIPLSLALNALRTFANRACMIEARGVIASYRRGIEILFDNFGEAFLLLLIQIAIQVVLGILLFVPSLITACCCLLWPVRLAAQGVIATYFSTLWTLAWREWKVLQEST